MQLSVGLSSSVPYKVTETDSSLSLTLFGVRPGPLPTVAIISQDPWISIARIKNSPRQFEIVLAREGPPYGYRVSWRNSKLVLTARRPPHISDSAPLKDLRIAVDAGHPPGGAVGPTGLTEESVTLEIAQRVTRLLEENGAHAIETRHTGRPISLEQRVTTAVNANAHAFVSIHTDAVPMGPIASFIEAPRFFWFFPHSQPLAMADAVALNSGIEVKRSRDAAR